jgi:hypothetical protein
MLDFNFTEKTNNGNNFWADFLKSVTSEKYGYTGQIYPYTTENLSGYMPKIIDNETQSVLTVSASGDHIINAYLLGAKKVDAFDCNILSQFYSNLKITALKNLELKDFKYFIETLDFEIYLDIRGELETLEREFFNSAYNYFSSGKEIRRSPLFNNKFPSKESNLYLQNENNYRLAQQKVKSTKLVVSDVENLVSKIMDEKKKEKRNTKYDVILLSNIADYAYKTYAPNEGSLERFNGRVVAKLDSLLNKNGKIIAAYIYDFDEDKKEHRSEIDNIKKIKKVFSNSKITKFQSVIEGKLDAILEVNKK